MIIILFVILWAIVCYNLAQKKNRDPGLGAIAGLIFGIFAVIYYLTVAPKKKTRKKK